MVKDVKIQKGVGRSQIIDKNLNIDIGNIGRRMGKNYEILK